MDRDLHRPDLLEFHDPERWVYAVVSEELEGLLVQRHVQIERTEFEPCSSEDDWSRGGYERWRTGEDRRPLRPLIIRPDGRIPKLTLVRVGQWGSFCFLRDVSGTPLSVTGGHAA